MPGALKLAQPAFHHHPDAPGRNSRGIKQGTDRP